MYFDPRQKLCSALDQFSFLSWPPFFPAHHSPFFPIFSCSRFETTYNTQVGRKKGDEQQAEAPKAEEPKAAKAEKKEKGAEGAKGKKGKKEKKAKKAPRSFTLDPKLESQFSSGRLYGASGY